MERIIHYGDYFALIFVLCGVLLSMIQIFMLMLFLGIEIYFYPALHVLAGGDKLDLKSNEASRQIFFLMGTALSVC